MKFLPVLFLIFLVGCEYPSKTKNVESIQSKMKYGVLYTGLDGKQLSEPMYRIDESTGLHVEYICERRLEGFGAGSRNVFETYVKVYNKGMVTKFQKVGTTCKIV